MKAQLRRYKKYNVKQYEKWSENSEDSLQSSGDGDRHTKRKKSEDVLFSSQGLELHVRARECYLRGKEILLTPSEYEIMRILLEHKGEAVKSEHIFYSLWPNEYYVKNTNTVSVHVRHIREKLGKREEKDKYIQTVWGVGYKIV